jgi:protoporphyrinogen oxidase
VGAEGVLVLGAGLAGLGCARALPGARVFEAQSHPGGQAWSHAHGGAWFDEGAHISHSRDAEFVRMITRGLEVHEIAASRVRNHWHGAWITYPVQNHLHELPAAARTRALADFVEAQAQGGATPADYEQWCLAQYGRYLTEHFYREYTDSTGACRWRRWRPTGWGGG